MSLTDKNEEVFLNLPESFYLSDSAEFKRGDSQNDCPMCCGLPGSLLPGSVRRLVVRMTVGQLFCLVSTGLE